MKLNKTLFYMELPPPIHGMTYVNNIINKELKEKKDYHIHDLNLSNDISEIGKMSLKKIIKNVSLILFAWKSFFIHNPRQVYIVLSASLFGMIRDLIILFPSILFNRMRIIHFHGFTYYDKCKESKIYKFLLKIICYKSKIIVLCNKQKDITYKILSKDSYVVNNPLSKDVLIDYKMIKEDNLKLLYISSINKLKGTFDLIESIKNIPNVELTIAGDIWAEKDDFYEAIAKYKHKINYIGFADEIMKKELLEKHHVFCVPSRLSEGSPISIIEAMAYGLPIISTNKGCIPEMIKKCGVIIDGSLNENNMKQAIVNMKNNYSIFSKEAILAYKEKHRKNVFIKRIEDILND